MKKWDLSASFSKSFNFLAQTQSLAVITLSQILLYQALDLLFFFWSQRLYYDFDHTVFEKFSSDIT